MDNRELIVGDEKFDLVCRLEPEKDAEGRIITRRPQERFFNPSGLRVHNHGHGPFCRFRIDANGFRGAGVYVLMIEGEAVYVGECEGLASRFNQGYGNISPRNCFEGGQQTNCRLNNLILEASGKGAAILLYFKSTRPMERFEQERRLIEKLRPCWNRSNGKSGYAGPSAPTEPKIPDKKELPGSKISPPVPSDGPTARDEILAVVSRMIRRRGANWFTIEEVVREMNALGTIYSDSTIRTQICSRLCANAPKNFGTTYEDFIRIGPGRYRLNAKSL